MSTHMDLEDLGEMKGADFVTSSDGVPADDWLSSVSRPIVDLDMLWLASSSWATSASEGITVICTPSRPATLDAVLQQRIDTKNYLQIATLWK